MGSMITATKNGPFVVDGSVVIRRRRIIQSEHGEPITWMTGEDLGEREDAALCRCGRSDDKPFCDGSHARTGFQADGTDLGEYADRADDLGGHGIEVKDDRTICVHAGFCGNRLTNIWKQVSRTDDSVVRAQVIAEIERCPSGALTYELAGSHVEPLLPEAIGVVDDGPLWITGGIPIQSSDDTMLETRNRVTLCRCGASSIKPLCDGSHSEVGFEDAGD